MNIHNCSFMLRVYTMIQQIAPLSLRAFDLVFVSHDLSHMLFECCSSIHCIVNNIVPLGCVHQTL